MLDNNYLRWYLLYLNKRNKDSQLRTLPPEVLTNSIGLDFLSYLLELICQCSVLYGFVTRSPNPGHASPKCIFRSRCCARCCSQQKPTATFPTPIYVNVPIYLLMHYLPWRFIHIYKIRAHLVALLLHFYLLWIKESINFLNQFFFEFNTKSTQFYINILIF